MGIEAAETLGKDRILEKRKGIGERGGDGGRKIKRNERRRRDWKCLKNSEYERSTNVKRVGTRMRN